MAENLSVLPNSISLQGSHDTNYPDLGTLTPVRGRILKKDDRILQWGYHETKQLISIRAELEKDFALIKRNKTLWELIERKMMEKGFRRSADQCKCKWKNLVNLYKVFVCTGSFLFMHANRKPNLVREMSILVIIFERYSMRFFLLEASLDAHPIPSSFAA